MEGVAEIRGLPVGWRVELRHRNEPPVLPGNKVLGRAEVGLVFPPDNGELNPLPLFLVREPVGEVLVIVKGMCGKLRCLADLAVPHPSEFYKHRYSASFTAVPEAVTMSMPLLSPRTS